MAYISGPLTDLTDEDRTYLFPLYESLASVCEEFGLKGYCPHQHTDPVRAASLTPEQIDNIDRRGVTSSFLVVMYAGMKSGGMGIEEELAHHAYKPVIMLSEFNPDRRVSRLVLGGPAVKQQLTFVDVEDACSQLRIALQKLKDQVKAMELPAPLDPWAHERVDVLVS